MLVAYTTRVGALTKANGMICIFGIKIFPETAVCFEGGGYKKIRKKYFCGQIY